MAKRKKKTTILKRHSTHGAMLDFRQNITWRIFRIMAEFIDGYQFLADFKKEVTIFGSARFLPSNPYYLDARTLAAKLAKKGYTVITGGGPGIMEAGNRGASEGGGQSVGLNIQLPHEQRQNNYVKRGMGFSYFFTRKVMLSVTSQAYIFFPGGFGTLDEFFEIITLIQTGKTPSVPVICVGREYWDALDSFLSGKVLNEHKAISHEDRSIFTIVDSIDEVMTIVGTTRDRPWNA